MIEKTLEHKNEVGKYMEQFLEEMSPWPSLQSLATTANSYGLEVSRQTLHNWMHGKTTPLYTLLNSYIRILEMSLDANTNPGKIKELNLLIDFFKTIKEKAHGNSQQ